MLSYTITIKCAFKSEETNRDKDWVSSINMDVHPVMAFYHYQCKIRDGQNFVVISQYGSFVFCSVFCKSA